MKRNQKHARRTLGIIFALLLIDILSFTVIIPLYPRILTNYHSIHESQPTALFSVILSYIHAFKRIAGASSSHRLDIILFGGLLGSLFSVLQSIVSPYIGALSDKYGRRYILLLTMVGNALSMFIWIYATTFDVFLMSRVVAGLSEGNVQLSLLMITDITTPVARGKALALVGIAFAVGFTFGPFLVCVDMSVGGIFGLGSFSGPAVFAFVLICFETMLMIWILPETLGWKKTAKIGYVEVHADNESKADAELLRKRKPFSGDSPRSPIVAGVTHELSSSTLSLESLSTIHFLFLMAFSGLEFTLTFLTFDKLDYTNMAQGKLLGFMGVLSAIIQGTYVRGKSGQKVGETGLIARGLIACCIGVIGLSMVEGMDVSNIDNTRYWIQGSGEAYLYASVALLAFTSGTVVNSLTSLASKISRQPLTLNKKVSEKGSGRIMGEFRGSGQRGRAIGPMLACCLYWWMGSTAAYRLMATFVAAVGLFFYVMI